MFILADKKRDVTLLIPRYLKCSKSFGVSQMCSSVCTNEGNTYVRLQSNAGIVRLDRRFQTKLFFMHENVTGVTVYKDKLYALIDPKPEYPICKVKVYTLNGNEVGSWTHGFCSESQVVIVDYQVVIPNRIRKEITVYSLAGKIVQCFSCSLLTESSPIFICAADRHCVVVSDYTSSQVFKLDLTTKKVIWTYKGVSNPRGVTCYRSRYILVANLSSKPTIWVLDVKTG